MSIISRLTQQSAPAQDLNRLSKEELEFILNLLKDISITGSQVEMFYNLVVKLQNQYVEQSK